MSNDGKLRTMAEVKAWAEREAEEWERVADKRREWNEPVNAEHAETSARLVRGLAARIVVDPAADREALGRELRGIVASRRKRDPGHYTDVAVDAYEDETWALAAEHLYALGRASRDGEVAALRLAAPIYVDRSTGRRPAVLGGECHPCLHRPPAHGSTCPKVAQAIADGRTVIDWAVPGPRSPDCDALTRVEATLRLARTCAEPYGSPPYVPEKLDEALTLIATMRAPDTRSPARVVAERCSAKVLDSYEGGAECGEGIEAFARLALTQQDPVAWLRDVGVAHARDLADEIEAVAAERASPRPSALDHAHGVCDEAACALCSAEREQEAAGREEQRKLRAGIDESAADEREAMARAIATEGAAERGPSCAKRGGPVESWIGTPPPEWRPGMRPPCIACGAKAGADCDGRGR